MLRFIALALLIALNAPASTVHGYYRKDGTYVHGYERKPRSTSTRAAVSPAPKAAPPEEVIPKPPRERCDSCARDGRGRIQRSSEARAEFKRENPCPATGKSYGACPGYVIDHVKPLACDGADAPTNMHWQTVAKAKAKDRVERKGCRVN